MTGKAISTSKKQF